jgi:hypothetical protein
VLAEIRMLSTESRLLEAELGMAPASESRAGIPKQAAYTELDALIDARRRRDRHDDADDPRLGLAVSGPDPAD